MELVLGVSGIGNIIPKILEIARNKTSDKNTVDELAALTSSNYSSGKYFTRAFGVSVSDFAFAALKWIGSPYSVEQFDKLYEDLPDERKPRINEIIEGYKL